MAPVLFALTSNLMQPMPAVWQLLLIQRIIEVAIPSLRKVGLTASRLMCALVSAKLVIANPHKLFSDSDTMTVASLARICCCTLPGLHLHGSSFSICDRDSSAIAAASFVFASLMTEEVVVDFVDHNP